MSSPGEDPGLKLCHPECLHSGTSGPGWATWVVCLTLGLPCGSYNFKPWTSITARPQIQVEQGAASMTKSHASPSVTPGSGTAADMTNGLLRSGA